MACATLITHTAGLWWPPPWAYLICCRHGTALLLPLHTHVRPYVFLPHTAPPLPHPHLPRVPRLAVRVDDLGHVRILGRARHARGNQHARLDLAVGVWRPWRPWWCAGCACGGEVCARCVAVCVCWSVRVMECVQDDGVCTQVSRVHAQTLSVLCVVTSPVRAMICMMHTHKPAHGPPCTRLTRTPHAPTHLVHVAVPELALLQRQ